MGNLTRDPELRQTPSGQTVCSFSIALNRAYKNQSGEWQEATDFVNCVAWGPLGERIGQYLKRGSRALVQGTLRSSSWEDKDTGQKRSKLEVWANDVTFLDSRGGDGEGGGGAHAAAAGSGPSAGSSKKKDDVVEDIGDEPINLDDIPF